MFLTYYNLNGSTTSNWVSRRKTASWMTFLMHWTSIKLLSLSKVSTEQLSLTSYLRSVIFPLYASILACPRRKGLYWSQLVFLSKCFWWNFFIGFYPFVCLFFSVVTAVYMPILYTAYSIIFWLVRFTYQKNSELHIWIYWCCVYMKGYHTGKTIDLMYLLYTCVLILHYISIWGEVDFSYYMFLKSSFLDSIIQTTINCICVIYNPKFRSAWFICFHKKGMWS